MENRQYLPDREDFPQRRNLFEGTAPGRFTLIQSRERSPDW